MATVTPSFFLFPFSMKGGKWIKISFLPARRYDVRPTSLASYALSVYLCVELDANETNCIPSPTHSFTLGLNHSFSANPPYRTLSFFSFRFHYMDFPDCLLLLLAYPSFYFLVFLFLHFLVVGSVQ